MKLKTSWLPVIIIPFLFEKVTFSVVGLRLKAQFV